MGILKLFREIFDVRASGESIIATQEKIYRKTQEMYPDAEPNELLASVYVSRMATHGKGQTPELLEEGALRCRRYACLPFPKNVRALGINFIRFERPDILKACPDFEEEFQELLRPINQAIKAGKFLELYRKFNPRLASGMPADTFPGD